MRTARTAAQRAAARRNLVKARAARKKHTAAGYRAHGRATALSRATRQGRMDVGTRSWLTKSGKMKRSKGKAGMLQRADAVRKTAGLPRPGRFKAMRAAHAAGLSHRVNHSPRLTDGMTTTRGKKFTRRGNRSRSWKQRAAGVRRGAAMPRIPSADKMHGSGTGLTSAYRYLPINVERRWKAVGRG